MMPTGIICRKRDLELIALIISLGFRYSYPEFNKIIDFNAFKFSFYLRMILELGCPRIVAVGAYDPLSIWVQNILKFRLPVLHETRHKNSSS